ncbi:MAG: class I SAM-dependent methyltransferase [Arthrobacter sp.]|uniref:class I SAM-dependent methyltransferase n=1 Tax=Arthrobacter sp. TaxID=1667 RepID=UPI0034787629
MAHSAPAPVQRRPRAPPPCTHAATIAPPGRRRKAAASRLAQAVLDYPSFVGNLLIRSRASGLSATAARLLAALPGVSRGLRRLVLGAGFDTRAHRAGRHSPVRFSEVDTAATRSPKHGLPAADGHGPARRHLRPGRIPGPDWWGRTVPAGFEPAERALFLWAGVPMHLNMACVGGTLDRIAPAAPAASSPSTAPAPPPSARGARSCATRGPPPAGFVVAAVPGVAGTRNRAPDRRRGPWLNERCRGTWTNQVPRHRGGGDGGN